MADNDEVLKRMEPAQRKWIADGAPGYGHLREAAQRMVDADPEEHGDIVPLADWKAQGKSTVFDHWEKGHKGDYAEYSKGGVVGKNPFARGGKVAPNNRFGFATANKYTKR